MGVDINTDVNLVVMVGHPENVTTIKREIYKSKKKYTLEHDDMPLLSQWIKKTMKNVSFSIVFLVEVTGFEPTTSWSRTKRATKLRYTSAAVSNLS